MTGRSLTYPLHFEALTAGMMFYLVLGFFYGTFTIVQVNIVATVVWLVLGGVFVLMFTGLLFEYGMDILLASARGEARPPAARASMASPRVFALVVLVAMIATIAYRLGAAGFNAASWTLWIMLLLLLPALILVNVLYSAGAMLNPVSLVLALRYTGWNYLRHLLLLTLTAALLVASLAGPFLLYLVFFPAFIYCEFLFFHRMGLSVRAKTEHFFTAVDFKADRAELQAVSASLAELNSELSEAYEWLRNGEQARVIEWLDSLVQRKGWATFEQLFGYISQWPDAGPALHLCRRYLERPEARATPMRALALGEWCLERSADFTLGNDTLQFLAERAALPAQCRAILRLVENHLARYPDTPHKADLLRAANDLRLASR